MEQSVLKYWGLKPGLKFDMKIFVNVARLEISQLFTQGPRRGHPCTLDTFLLQYFYGNQDGNLKLFI